MSIPVAKQYILDFEQMVYGDIAKNKTAIKISLFLCVIKKSNPTKATTAIRDAINFFITSAEIYIISAPSSKIQLVINICNSNPVIIFIL